MTSQPQTHAQLVKAFDPLVKSLIGGEDIHRAAFWGQPYQESSDNPSAAEFPGKDKGGIGLDQWTGPRRLALISFATKRGKPWTDTETQVRFACQELSPGGEKAHAWVQTLKTTTLRAATETMMVLYEGPAGAAQELSRWGTTTANMPRRFQGAELALAAIQELAAQQGTTKMTDTASTAGAAAVEAALNEAPGKNTQMILDALAGLETKLFSLETKVGTDHGVPTFVMTMVEGLEQKLINALVAQVMAHVGNLDITALISAEFGKLFGGDTAAAKG